MLIRLETLTISSRSQGGRVWWRETHCALSLWGAVPWRWFCELTVLGTDSQSLSLSLLLLWLRAGLDPQRQLQSTVKGIRVSLMLGQGHPRRTSRALPRAHRDT